MKKTLIFFFLALFFTQTFNAQDNQFVRTFTKVAVTDDNGEFEEYKEGKNSLVFNYGEGSDIKFYKANGGTEILRRISDITEDKTKDGREYQWNKALDEKGNEMVFVLYTDGEVRMLYSDKTDGSLILAISLIP